jgi:hypothetical protein
MDNTFFKNQIKKTNLISDVTKLYENLLELNYNPILVLDIDGVVLSEKYGKILVEQDITKLIDITYSYNPNNLIFLTAREVRLADYTRKKLNKAKLLHKGKFINYNIICSPCNNDGNPTKGLTLYNYMKKGIGQTFLSNNKENWIIFVDDLQEQINSVNSYINKFDCNYTLFHYEY